MEFANFFGRSQPYAPADLELTQSYAAYHLYEGVEPGLASIRRPLVKCWKDVDTITRVSDEEEKQF